jgi:hypothetical protein
VEPRIGGKVKGTIQHNKHMIHKHCKLIMRQRALAAPWNNRQEQPQQPQQQPQPRGQ